MSEKRESVVISGISGRFPSADDVEELWEELMKGTNLASPETLWHIADYALPTRRGQLKSCEYFDHEFFGYSSEDADLLDPQMRLFLEVVYEAICDAGIRPESLRGSKTSVHIGACYVDVERAILEKGTEVDPFLQLTASRVSHAFDFRGHSFVIDTACASSFSCFNEAFTAMEAGVYENAIIGGLAVHSDPRIAMGFRQLRMISEDGKSKCLDKDVDGYCRSETVVCLFLQTRRNAKRAYGQVLGSMTNTDGYKPEGITYPRFETQKQLMVEVLRKYKVDPIQIEYIEAHMTGTPAGDDVESRAIADAYRENVEKPLRFGCLKSNIGHTEGASGCIAVAKVCLAFQRGQLPPNIHFKTPNPKIEPLLRGIVAPVLEPIQFNCQTVPINSFGFGGVNIHAILAQSQTCSNEVAFSNSNSIHRLINFCGRTEESVFYAFQWIERHMDTVTNEFLHLLNEVSKTELNSGITCRGFMLTDGKTTIHKEVTNAGHSKQTVFLFSSQGNPSSLVDIECMMKITAFRESIERSTNLLKKFDYNLEYNKCVDRCPANNDLLFTICQQIAFVDVFQNLNIQPDFIVCESFGEIAAGYADGHLTHEEALIIGLKLNSMHASSSNSVEQKLLTYLNQVVPKERQQSTRWVSIRDELNKNGCLSADQIINRINTLLPECRHKDYLSLSSLIINIGSWPELIPPSHTANSAKDPKTSTSLLLMLGKMYNAGINPAIEKLYPPVKYPVAPTTHSISPLIKWKHDKKLMLMQYPDYFHGKASSYQTYQIDMTDPKWHHLDGHNIDGRFLFPATAFLSLGWQAATGFAKDYLPYSVEFRDIRFIRAAIVPKVGTLKLKVNYNKDTGNFVVSEAGSVCATGYCKLADLEQSVNTIINFDVPNERGAYLLNKKEIYKEFRVRGYDYGANFQLLEEATTDGRRGKVTWKGQFINFADCVLQLGIFERKDRLLYVPTFIDYLGFDSKKFTTYLQKHESTEQCLFDVQHYNRTYVVCDGALVIKNVIGIQQQRRLTDQIPETQVGRFVPHYQVLQSSNKQQKLISDYQDLCLKLVKKVQTKNSSEDIIVDKEFESRYVLYHVLNDLSTAGKNINQIVEVVEEKKYNLASDVIVTLNKDTLLTNPLDLVMENMFQREVRVVEINPTDSLLCSIQLDRVQNYTKTFLIRLIHPTLTQDKTHSEIQQIFKWKLNEEVSLHSSPQSLDLILYKDFSSSLIIHPNEGHLKMDIQRLFEKSQDCLKDGGFLLITFRSQLSAAEKFLLKAQTAEMPELMCASNLIEMSNGYEFIKIEEKFDIFGNVTLLFRKKSIKSNVVYKPIIINTETEKYTWIEELQKAFQVQPEQENVCQRIWLIGNDTDHNGLLGFMNCMRKEAKGVIVRSALGLGAQLTQEVFNKDLTINLFEENQWGSYRYTTVDLDDYLMETNQYYLDVQTKGDLSSLRWFQSNVDSLIDIHYASLNFKDVMVASGRVPMNAYPESKDIIPIGIEYSGIDRNNNRICGVNKGGAIASSVRDSLLQWTVPNQWSLEEAATIPLVYMTVYYALLFRATLKRGESVLIHAGSGGVGQAAICLCLKMGCKIYTTVGNERKREFLKKRFPSLKDEHIGCSRDLTFEEFILKSTNGKGVDVILNSLAEDKLRASVRCLADFGRFVEIGKYDIIINSPFDQSLLGNNKSFQVTCLAHLMDDVGRNQRKGIHIMKELHKMMAEDMESGIIQPLERRVFDKSEVEDAFRFMASGKHIGKVLIKMKSEDSAIIEPMVSIPQTFFSSAKSYIISGGLGGFGLELASWMVSRGARKLFLTSRNGVQTNYQRYVIDKMKEAGACVSVFINDANSMDKTVELLKEAQLLAPIGGIFILNLLLKDGLFEEQSVDNFDQVCASKVFPSINFDRASKSLNCNLDYFVCFSSIASSFGNLAQTNYGFANSVMERVCELRRKSGLHGLAIQWGAIGDVGYVAENIANTDFVFSGTVIQRIPSCLQALDRILQSPFSVCSTYLRASSRSGMTSAEDLLKRICHVLGVKDPEKLHPQTTLNDLGLDSLMAIEIKQGLEREYDTIMSTQEIRNLTINDLKEIDMNKRSEHSKSGQDENRLAFTNKYLLLSTSWQIELNSDIPGVPIFLFPGIEGDFTDLISLVKHINRPVIGLTWASDFESCSSIHEVGSIYAKFITESYSLSEYNLVGYSYGAAVAFEVAIQLQQTFGISSVKKVIFLDGAPEMIKLQISESDLDTTDNKCVTETFMNYVSKHAKLENLEIVKLREELLELPSKHKKAVKLAEVIRLRINQNCDPDLLLAAIERLVQKMRMIYYYEQELKYVGNASLIRAKDKSLILPFKTVDEDYGLSKIVDGKVEVIIKEGHHQSFLEINETEIGQLIESCFNELYT